MNRADQLYPEVQQIITLLTRRHNPFMPANWGWDPNGWTATLLTDDVCEYTKQGYRELFVRLENITPVDGKFTFDEPIIIDSQRQERHTVAEIWLDHEDDAWDQEYRYTFTEVESELDIARKAFETEAAIRFGPDFEGPFGAKFKENFTTAFEHNVGKTNTTEEEMRYHLAFKGPGGRRLEAVRYSQVLRRHMSNDAYYDYRITLGHKVEAPLTRQVSFANKNEFLDVVRGLAAVDKAIYQGRSWVPFYSGGNAQPDADIKNADAGTTITPEHIKVGRERYEVTTLSGSPPSS